MIGLERLGLSRRGVHPAVKVEEHLFNGKPTRAGCTRSHTTYRKPQKDMTLTNSCQKLGSTTAFHQQTNRLCPPTVTLDPAR